MKLLIITNIPTPYRIAFFNVLNKEIIERNGSFQVLYCAKNEPGRHWNIEQNEQKFDHQILDGFHIKFKKLYLHLNISVVSKIKEFNPDYILFAGSWNMLTVIYSLYYLSISRSSVKTIFWSEGHDGSVRYKRGIVPHLRSFILNKFNAFAVPNQRSKNYLFEYLKLIKKPIIILPNTVDGDFYQKPHNWNENNTQSVKEKFGLPNNSKICIQVAQIEERKSAKDLVLYWEKLSATIKQGFILVFVGEGSLKEELIQYANKNFLKDIFFLGNQQKENVRNLLFASNVFVLLTKNDPNPLSLIEASFAGLPILTTRFAGNCDEIIHLDTNGIVIESVDFEQFQTAMISMSKLSSLHESGEWSLSNAKRNFDIELIAKNFIDQIVKNISLQNKVQNNH